MDTKKLAEWAGFEYSHESKIRNFFTGKLGRLIKFWIYPSGHVGELPNFPESPDACFQWLVPKLQWYQLNNWNKKKEHIAFVSVEEGKVFSGKDSSSSALALCLAIEKLIEG